MAEITTNDSNLTEQRIIQQKKMYGKIEVMLVGVLILLLVAVGYLLLGQNKAIQSATIPCNFITNQLPPRCQTALPGTPAKTGWSSLETFYGDLNGPPLSLGAPLSARYRIIVTCKGAVLGYPVNVSILNQDGTVAIPDAVNSICSSTTTTMTYEDDNGSGHQIKVNTDGVISLEIQEYYG